VTVGTSSTRIQTWCGSTIWWTSCWGQRNTNCAMTGCCCDNFVVHSITCWTMAVQFKSSVNAVFSNVRLLSVTFQTCHCSLPPHVNLSNDLYRTSCCSCSVNTKPFSMYNHVYCRDHCTEISGRAAWTVCMYMISNIIVAVCRGLYFAMLLHYMLVRNVGIFSYRMTLALTVLLLSSSWQWVLKITCMYYV